MSEPARPLTVEELLAHAGWIERVARSLVRDVARAEDVVQETWVAALRTPPREESRVRSWLYSVMKNVVKTQSRSESSRRSRETAAAREDLQADSVELVSRAEAQQLVIAQVTALEEPIRTTLLLHYFDELPLNAIAARYGVPIATVKTRLRRALEQIREKLHARDGDRWPLALAPLIGSVPLAPSGNSDAGERIPARRVGARRAARWSLAAGIVVAAGLTASWLANRSGGRGDDVGGQAVTRAEDAPARSPARADERAGRAAVPGVAPESPSGTGPGAIAVAPQSPVAPPAPDGPGVAFRAQATASEPADSLRGVRFRFRPLAKGPVDESEDRHGVADAAGAVEVRLPTSLADGRPIFSFEVSVEDAAIVPWWTRIDVPKPQAPPAAFGPLTRAAVVTGRVRAADGARLRDAMAVATEVAFPNAMVDSVRVAEDGSYRLRLRPGTPQIVAVAATDRAPYHVRLTPDAPGERALDDAVLEPGETLSGGVVDTLGAPVAGARVSVQSGFLDLKLAAGVHRLTASADRIRIFSAERPAGTDGRFSISGLASVEYTATVTPPVGASARLTERLRWSVTPGGPEREFRIDAATLRVTFLREGVPVAKFRFLTIGSPVPAHHVTDERGEVALLVPPDEETVLEFGEKPDVRRHTVRAGPAGETVASTVELGPSVEPATWRLRLLGLPPEAQGLCGVRLHRLDHGEPPRFPPVHDLSRTDGEFVVARLAPGRYRAHVRPGTAWHDPANLYAEIATEIVLSPGQETRDELRVTPAGRLSILVRDPEGNRIDARCDLRDAAGNRVHLFSRSPVASGQGEFLDLVLADGPTSVFPTLAPGRYVLHLEAVGFLAGRAEFEIRAGEVTEVEATLRR